LTSKVGRNGEIITRIFVTNGERVLRPQALNQAKSVSADKHQWITRLHGQVIDAIRRLLVAHPGWHSLRLDF